MLMWGKCVLIDIRVEEIVMCDLNCRMTYVFVCVSFCLT